MSSVELGELNLLAGAVRVKFQHLVCIEAKAQHEFSLMPAFHKK
jgi:hypothetical protein